METYRAQFYRAPIKTQTVWGVTFRTMLRFCDRDAFTKRSRSYRKGQNSLHGQALYIFFPRKDRSLVSDSQKSFPGSRSIYSAARGARYVHANFSRVEAKARACVIVTETVIRSTVCINNRKHHPTKILFELTPFSIF